MTTLVTGGAGYVGSHIVHELVDANERVIVLDNLSTGFSDALPAAIPLVVGDCGDQDLLSLTIAKYQVTAIIHCAASVVVSEAIKDPLGYYRNNTENSRKLIESAILGRVPCFIFSSTAAVYGNPEQALVSEDTPLQPMSPYGRSKLMTEMMLSDIQCAHPLNYVALRYFNVAGADPTLRTGQSSAAATHLIKVAVQTALGIRPRVQVFGTNYPTPDGTCIRDYIHVTDLARIHVDVLRYLRAGGGSVALNCGYGRGFSVLQVIEAVKRISGVDFRVDLAPPRLGDPTKLVASSDRLRRLFEWQPRFDDLEAIIAHAYAWEKKLTTLAPSK
jgi:UDP-glucose 4-epimerase